MVLSTVKWGLHDGALAATTTRAVRAFDGKSDPCGFGESLINSTVTLGRALWCLSQPEVVD